VTERIILEETLLDELIVKLRGIWAFEKVVTASPIFSKAHTAEVF
jgi:hypothetical protein